MKIFANGEIAKDVWGKLRIKNKGIEMLKRLDLRDWQLVFRT